MRSAAILYLVLIHAALLWLVSDKYALPDRGGVESYADYLLHGVRRAAQAPTAVAVVGDSRVQDLAASTLGVPAENYGIGSDTLGGVADRLPHYRLDRARSVILEAGINEWSRRRFSGFKLRYRRMLDAVPAGVPVLALELIPLDEPAAKPVWQGINVQLGRANDIIRRLCVARPGCRVVPQPFGAALAPAMHIGDGLHLSVAGIDLMAASLRAALESPGRSALATPGGSRASPAAR